MEAKKDLNNTQRKMLDEIYTKRFNEKIKPYRSKRHDQLETIRDNALEEAKKSKDVEKFRELVAKTKALKDKLYQGGISVYDSYDGVVKVEIKSNHPKVQSFNDETEKTLDTASEAQAEMRTRIYGLNTTYEEVDKEIAQILKGLKI